jgi:hypothetical protein
MAMVIITIQDRPDHTTEVRLDCEPTPTSSTSEFTVAQKLAAAALAAIERAMKAEPPKIIIPSETPIQH